MLEEAEKALGFKINLETIGLNDLQARVDPLHVSHLAFFFPNRYASYVDNIRSRYRERPFGARYSRSASMPTRRRQLSMRSLRPAGSGK